LVDSEDSQLNATTNHAVLTMQDANHSSPPNAINIINVSEAGTLNCSKDEENSSISLFVPTDWQLDHSLPHSTDPSKPYTAMEGTKFLTRGMVQESQQWFESQILPPLIPRYDLSVTFLANLHKEQLLQRLQVSLRTQAAHLHNQLSQMKRDNGDVLDPYRQRLLTIANHIIDQG
jgi:hypothetical protein